MYMMYCGVPPFSGDSYKEAMTKARFNELKFRAPIWNSVSKEAKDIVTQMMQKTAKTDLQWLWLYLILGSIPRSIKPKWIDQYSSTL